MSRSRLRASISLLSPALLCVAACTSYSIRPRAVPPPGFAELPADTAQICVYRPHKVALLVPAVVQDNGTVVGMTRGPSYFCYLAEPGHHSIVTRYGDDVDARLGTDDSTQATIVVVSGERYYLHHDVSAIFSLTTRWEGDPAHAEGQMTDCTHVELDRVPPGTTALAPGAVAPARPVPVLSITSS
ncbi:hypothetical protein [Nannocystis exedens]|uniref:hypothetical protein n=1 Tax=Nannocystis exedens TaxID=54 RepID=UPI000BCA65E3|nr:hypothetical protein [Nannocystis exedens]PCC74942.1 hypothetical protein NAEX_08042 [Nannocystis exedens]